MKKLLKANKTSMFLILFFTFCYYIHFHFCTKNIQSEMGTVLFICKICCKWADRYATKSLPDIQ